MHNRGAANSKFAALFPLPIITFIASNSPSKPSSTLTGPRLILTTVKQANIYSRLKKCKLEGVVNSRITPHKVSFPALSSDLAYGPAWMKRSKIYSFSARTEEGFVLSLVVIVGLILGIGAMALVTKGASSMVSSIKQQQSKEALAVAEAGMDIVLGKLNTDSPAFLVKTLPEWSNQDLLSGTVDNASGTSIGRWRVAAYTYKGNTLYGGTGTLKIQGERLAEGSSTQVLSKAEIEQEFSIIYKSPGFPVARGVNRWQSFEQLP